MRLSVLAAGLCAFSGLALAEPPAIDVEELQPVLAHSWVAGATCESGGATVDWVIDADGGLYRRDDGFTWIDRATLKDGLFTTYDAIGIGLTKTVYWLKGDALALKDQIWFEDEDEAGTPTVMVRDGAPVSPDDGEPVMVAPPPPYKACPPRVSFHDPAAVKALNGAWADVEGGDCATGAGVTTLDLERGVPRIRRSSGDEIHVLSISPIEGGYETMEGGAMEAWPRQYLLKGEGRIELLQPDDPSAPRRMLKRCG